MLNEKKHIMRTRELNSSKQLHHNWFIDPWLHLVAPYWTVTLSCRVATYDDNRNGGTFSYAWPSTQKIKKRKNKDWNEIVHYLAEFSLAQLGSPPDVPQLRPGHMNWRRRTARTMRIAIVFVALTIRFILGR
jgi:hypothetical protein